MKRVRGKSRYDREKYLKQRKQNIKRSKAWALNNPERRLEIGRRWRANNLEKARAYARAYQAANPEKKKAYQKKWEDANPAYVYMRSRRSAWRAAGLNPKEAEALFRSANNCAVCGAASPKLCIDHDHKTGEIRGVICDRCNRGIGLLGDNIGGLIKALDYLRRVAGRKDRDAGCA